MARDDEKTLRQLSLLSFLLEAGRPVTAQEVLESVEGYAGMTPQAFKKRFFEDREELKEAGIVIERMVDARSGYAEAYYLPQTNFRLPEITLTPEEVATLYGTVLLLGERFPFQRPLRLAVAALEHCQAAPARVAPPKHAQHILVTQGFDHDPATTERLATIDSALRAFKTVCFEYQGAWTADVQERTVDPYGVYLIGGHWYLVGRDHARDAIRMFRLDRMIGKVRLATRKTHDFIIPDDYDPTLYQARPPWILSEPVGTAEVLVHERLVWWVDRVYARFAQYREEREQGVFYLFPYAEPDPLLAWVVTHRRQIRLLGPAELVERLLAGLARVVARHGGPDGHREDVGRPQAEEDGC